MSNRQLKWEDIKKQYPHQNVGLVNIDYGVNEASVNKAVVKYTDAETPYEEMLSMYLNGEILLRYTTLDEDEVEGVI